MMDTEPNFTDRGIIIMGNLGKFIYRMFIVIMLYNIYTHLMGETTVLVLCTLIVIFPILWITIKELGNDLDCHANKPTIHDSQTMATKQTISTIKENPIEDNTITHIEERD